MSLVHMRADGTLPLAYTPSFVPVKDQRAPAWGPSLQQLQAEGLNPTAAGTLAPDKKGVSPLPGLYSLARAQGIDPNDPSQRPRFIQWLNKLQWDCKLSELVGVVKGARSGQFGPGSPAFKAMNDKGLGITKVLGPPVVPAQTPPKTEDVPLTDPTQGFHLVKPGDSLWKIAEGNLDQLLTDDQKKADVSRDQKVQWGVEELQRRNPEKRFDPALQDGQVATGGGSGRDPDLIHDGEWIRVHAGAGELPPPAQPAATDGGPPAGGPPGAQPVAYTAPAGGTDPLLPVFVANTAAGRGGFALDLTGGHPPQGLRT